MFFFLRINEWLNPVVLGSSGARDDVYVHDIFVNEERFRTPESSKSQAHKKPMTDCPSDGPVSH